MRVIVYTLIFILIVAAVGVGGMICESDKFEKKTKRARRFVRSAAERTVEVLLMPVEAANYIYESLRTR
ncbi:MAG: hypothetical protein IKN38_06975 [Clostridia bacterium]|nr:hypothetical protein [Clostridia bacterium]